jgi:hypothetical protein
MLNKIQEKLTLLPLTEPSTFLRRINVKLKNDWGADSWAQKRLIVNHEYRFIYCSIPKNASSSILKAIVATSHSKRKEKLLKLSRNSIHIYTLLNYSLASYTYAEAKQIIDSDYFKFAIVRNPWVRLVSTYSNYLVRLLSSGQVSDLAKDVAKYIYGENDYSKYEDTITFEQFANYVSAVEDTYLDQHCKSQYLFLGGIKYDFIGRMENLYRDLEYIQEKIKFTLELPKLNSTNYSRSSNSEQNFSKFSPSRLRKLETGIPDYTQFYTPKLVELVGQRYAKDIEMFDYDFK